MRTYNMRPNPRPDEARLIDLLDKRENARDPGAKPSGNTYGSLQAGLTQLGRGIAHRMATSKQNRLDGQIQELDPTGEIVRALMRGRR